MNTSEKIEQMLKMGYTWEQIEEILDTEVEESVIEVERITQIIHSHILGSFEVNAN